MASEGFAVRVDASQVEAFLKAAPNRMKDVVLLYVKQGGHIVAALQKDDASKRLGVETAESHMQHPDASRPKGIYINSIQVRVAGAKSETGPDVPYQWWVERGSEASSGVPKSHAASAFRGHRIVERSTRDAVDPLGFLLGDILGKETSRAVREAGGKG